MRPSCSPPNLAVPHVLHHRTVRFGSARPSAHAAAARTGTDISSPLKSLNKCKMWKLNIENATCGTRVQKSDIKLYRKNRTPYFGIPLISKAYKSILFGGFGVVPEKDRCRFRGVPSTSIHHRVSDSVFRGHGDLQSARPKDSRRTTHVARANVERSKRRSRRETVFPKVSSSAWSWRARETVPGPCYTPENSHGYVEKGSLEDNFPLQYIVVFHFHVSSGESSSFVLLVVRLLATFVASLLRS